MADLSDLLAGGQGVAPQALQFEIAHQSGTFTAKFSGLLCMLIAAGSGSGPVLFGANAGCGTGAGAGEMALRILNVEANTTMTHVIGPGGAAVTRSTAGLTDGNDGSDTTVVGTDVNVIVKGGKKGVTATISAGATLDGGAGGSGGSGGDKHFPGGRGGNIANRNFAHITGGGALNPFGLTAQTGTRGGDVAGTPTASCQTGGGGVKGRGGDRNSSSGLTPGGGAGSSANDNANAATDVGANQAGVRQSAALALISAAVAPFGIALDGGGGVNATTPGNGGGSGAHAGATPAAAGVFAGYGATVSAAGAATMSIGALAAASGALICTATSTNAPGGNGFVIYMLFPRV